MFCSKLWEVPLRIRRSQWPCGLRRRSTAADPLRLWIRIPPGAWMFGCCECCVLSGRGLCDGLITRPGESYRWWSVVVCGRETSKTRRLKPATGLWKIQPQGCKAKKTNNNKPLRIQSTTHKSVTFHKQTGITMNCQQNLVLQNMFGYVTLGYCL